MPMNKGRRLAILNCKSQEQAGGKPIKKVMPFDKRSTELTPKSQGENYK